jgi:hypothetical protein
VEIEYPQVFEDTTGEHDHAHDDERSGALFDDEADTGFTADAARDRARQGRDPDLDGEAADIMQEARELTERMRENTADDGADEAETE